MELRRVRAVTGRATEGSGRAHSPADCSLRVGASSAKAVAAIQASCGLIGRPIARASARNARPNSAEVVVRVKQLKAANELPQE